MSYNYTPPPIHFKQLVISKRASAQVVGLI